MYHLMIGDTILRLRKEKGMTQEQLSNMIGVSAGAVCKWETGNSTPDIALLAPLARAFHVSLDELFSFTPILSETEERHMKAKLRDVFTQKGYEEGVKQCKKVLMEYPNSIGLKLSIAGLMQLYAMVWAEESEKLYKLRAKDALDLLEEVVASKDASYVSQGLFVMASMQMMLGNYVESERILKKLPNSFVDPMAIYPILLQTQGKNEEAKNLCKKMLLSYLNQSTAMLATIATTFISTENYEEAQCYIDAICQVQNLFDVGLHSGEYHLCKLYIKKQQLDLAAKHFKIHVEKLMATAYDYSDHNFFKGLQLEVDVEGQAFIRKKMYQSYIEETGLKVLAGQQDYEDAIRILKESSL